MPGCGPKGWICGGYTRGWLARGLLSEEAPHQAQEQFRANWGRADAEPPFSVNGPGPEDPESQRMGARFERMCAMPTTVATLFELAARIDIMALLPSITQPALVMHRAEETTNGRSCADDFLRLMPQAEHHVVPGKEHLVWEGDIDRYIAPIVEFITGAQPEPPRPTRSLATVLFSDPVGSTAHLARVGDTAWRALIGRHDGLCADLVAGHGGRLVKFTGVGVTATFDAPTIALACADALRAALSRLDLTARFGVHTGEIELRGGDIGGLGVVVAARIMDRAEGGQILAWDLTRQLMLGAPCHCKLTGTHALKGVPGHWPLYAVSGR